MASSRSSLNLSFSTGAILFLFLLPILFLGCFRTASSAVIRTNPNDRWLDPCAGGTPAVAASVALETVTMTTGETLDAFAELSRRSIGLKQIVNGIKNEYVVARFDETTLAEEEMANAEFVITGSPSWNISSDNMTETLLVCYENLARLAVLTRLTREAEETANGNRDFATHFQRIEGHAESGLYVIMCHLYDVMRNLNIVVMSPETVAEVSSIRLPEVSSNAIRHVRDYMVLLVQEDSADKLNSSFDQLVGSLHVLQETTTSSTQ